MKWLSWWLFCGACYSGSWNDGIDCFKFPRSIFPTESAMNFIWFSERARPAVVASRFALVVSVSILCSACSQSDSQNRPVGGFACETQSRQAAMAVPHEFTVVVKELEGDENVHLEVPDRPEMKRMTFRGAHVANILALHSDITSVTNIAPDMEMSDGCCVIKLYRNDSDHSEVVIGKRWIFIRTTLKTQDAISHFFYLSDDALFARLCREINLEYPFTEQ